MDETLRNAYVEVQRRKNEITGPEDIDREAIGRKLAEELPDMPPEQHERILELTVGGVAWVAKMLADHDLSFVQSWGVAEALADSVKDGAIGTNYTPEQGVDLGVGAGLYTGMWMAFLIASGEITADPQT
jgi:hypothetical protein